MLIADKSMLEEEKRGGEKDSQGENLLHFERKKLPATEIYYL